MKIFFFFILTHLSFAQDIVRIDKRKQVMEEQLEKLSGEYKLLEEELKRSEENLSGKDLVELKKRNNQILLEKKLSEKKALCERFPTEQSFCLSPKEKEDLADSVQKENCLLDRSLVQTPEELQNHDQDWRRVKKCSALLAKKEVVAEAKKEVRVEPKAVAEKKEVAKAEGNEDELSPRNYRPDTCRWVEDLPRRIVNGPGCTSRGRSRICTGYVICDQIEGGGKFIRMSTCSTDKCGASDGDAVRCTKDQGYFSEKPASEHKQFMSPKLKKILSGSTEQ
jgi:hypothetical protein